MMKQQDLIVQRFKSDPIFRIALDNRIAFLEKRLTGHEFQEHINLRRGDNEWQEQEINNSLNITRLENQLQTLCVLKDMIDGKQKRLECADLNYEDVLYSFII